MRFQSVRLSGRSPSCLDLAARGGAGASADAREPVHRAGSRHARTRDARDRNAPADGDRAGEAARRGFGREPGARHPG